MCVPRGLHKNLEVMLVNRFVLFGSGPFDQRNNCQRFSQNKWFNIEPIPVLESGCDFLLNFQ